MCLQTVCIFKLDCIYLQTFTSWSESDCSQAKSHCDCLKTGCLPPGKLCSRLSVQSNHPEAEAVARSVAERGKIPLNPLERRSLSYFYSIVTEDIVHMADHNICEGTINAEAGFTYRFWIHICCHSKMFYRQGINCFSETVSQSTSCRGMATHF